MISLSEARESKKVEAESTATFDADAFMNLLLVQLRNQNPMEPMKENEMVAQMAQLNSVQELQKMNLSLKELERSNQLLSGSSLIGKMITYLDDQGLLVDTLVEAVVVNNNDVSLISGEVSVPLSKVKGVQEAEL